MTEFFEMFAPGTRHWREKQELDKTLLVEVPSGDPDRPGSRVDLDAGTATIVNREDAGDSAEKRRERRARRPRRTRG